MDNQIEVTGILFEGATFEGYKGKRKMVKDQSRISGWLEYSAPLTEELATVLGCLPFYQGADDGIVAPTLKRQSDSVSAEFLPLNGQKEVQFEMNEVGLHTFKAVRELNKITVNFKITNKAGAKAIKFFEAGGGWSGKIQINATQGFLFQEAEEPEPKDDRQKNLDWDDSEGNSRKARGTDDDPNETAAEPSTDETEKKRAKKVRTAMAKEGGKKGAKRGRRPLHGWKAE
jgi:hypothetical protein